MISGYRRYARIALAVAFLVFACLVLQHASIASADNDTSPPPSIATTLPETGPPAPSIPVVPTPTEQSPSTPSEPTQAPVVPPSPDPAPIVEPPASEPIVEEPVVQEPIYVEPVPEIVEPEPTTAAPTTAAPTTAAPAATRATFGSPIKSTETIAPAQANLATTLPPDNPIYLQALVIVVLVGIGVWYLRFMKRGGKRLGTASASPVK